MSLKVDITPLMTEPLVVLTGSTPYHGNVETYFQQKKQEMNVQWVNGELAGVLRAV